MILNNSRVEVWNACKQLAYNTDELGLTSLRTPQALLVGGAFHAGLAVINAKSGDLTAAQDRAEEEYRTRSNWSKLLKEERVLGEADIALTRSMVRKYGEHYLQENYQVLAPEIGFRVALPGTEHHCWYFHKLLQGLYPAVVPDWENCNGSYSIGPEGQTCFQPHYLVGTTDAVIQWNKAIWLMEHKTTAYDLYNDSPQSKNWIANWLLSTQATCYIYGIWKSTGVLPHGVLLNVVIKPRSNARIPTFDFYREAFLRPKEMLLQYETEISRLMTDYETRMRTGEVWKNPAACFRYNRKCDFHDSCIHNRIEATKFTTRPPDYVNAAYYKVLGLEPPTHTEEKENPIE